MQITFCSNPKSNEMNLQNSIFMWKTFIYVHPIAIKYKLPGCKDHWINVDIFVSDWYLIHIDPIVFATCAYLPKHW